MHDDGRRVLVGQSLVAGYGKRPVVNDVSVSLEKSEVVAIIGHNGAGKSTLLKSIFGLVPLYSGSVVLNGTAIRSPAPPDMIRSGVAYVPQGNSILGDLSVRENLSLSGHLLPPHQSIQSAIDRVVEMFPALKSLLKRRAGTLSGGQKQTLALASALILSPRIILMDEPSLGLAPPAVTAALATVDCLRCESEISVLVVEQKVRQVLKIADRVYVIGNGQVTFSGAAKALQDDDVLRKVYL